MVVVAHNHTCILVGQHKEKVDFTQCLKITQKVSFCNIASEASYVYLFLARKFKYFIRSHFWIFAPKTFPASLIFGTKIQTLEKFITFEFWVLLTLKLTFLQWFFDIFLNCSECIFIRLKTRRNLDYAVPNFLGTLKCPHVPTTTWFDVRFVFWECYRIPWIASFDWSDERCLPTSVPA